MCHELYMKHDLFVSQILGESRPVYVTNYTHEVGLRQNQNLSLFLSLVFSPSLSLSLSLPLSLSLSLYLMYTCPCVVSVCLSVCLFIYGGVGASLYLRAN